MSDAYRKAAFDMALQGRTVKQIEQNLIASGATAKEATKFAKYAVEGEPTDFDKKEMKNYNKRAARKAAGILGAYYDKADLPTSACDLLTDIMHLAARSRTGFDFDETLERARDHFNGERRDAR